MKQNLLEPMLESLTRDEKVQLLQLILKDVGNNTSGIESQQGVCGGSACIIHTRIPVWLLVHQREQGSSEADILIYYPTLRAEDLVNAWSYYRSHKQEILEEIKENQDA
ncbi:MAG: DUF433 domain-containing protein [Leptospiraceae bacterium]|nr:DUF433 domain-containing protein [Leptospiraceae bacterium]MBK9499896.1 DUF433 domain-containing protein [Leptospiraceae bacterium]MBL0263490.1 DUF433 domain-containing protein [Leptospiraceae bacterium]MBP9164200.1 DUF433 domain-containing protein [Leptospiraceae bacterium]